MIRDINLSQMLAMIAVSGNIKKIKTGSGNLAWSKWEEVDPTKDSYTIDITWDRGEYCGSDNQYICMALQEIRKPYPHERHKDNRFYEPILHAYYYRGDNCNRNTKFIYEIIGNEIDIIDDIGLVGNGGEYRNKNLLKINPHDIYRMKVRSEGRWAEKTSQ